MTRYRIFQEMLQNILKHAEVITVYIQIRKRNDRLLIIVEDNGIGFRLWKN